MIKETELAASEALGLPKLDLRFLGRLLFDEGCNYNQLPPDQVQKVGTYTSFVLHDLADGMGQWISIHYRENLDRLNYIGSSVNKAKAFLKAIGEDLDRLARILKEESNLNNVRMIFGLTTLSAAWGGRHGFDTVHFTNNPELIRRHFASMAENSAKDINGSKSLTLFSITPARFIEKFFIEDSSS